MTGQDTDRSTNPVAALRSAFVRAAARYVPALRPDDVEPSFAGVRAQALGRDGRIAPSPAATSSLAIGRHVAEEAGQAFGL